MTEKEETTQSNCLTETDDRKKKYEGAIKHDSSLKLYVEGFYCYSYLLFGLKCDPHNS